MTRPDPRPALTLGMATHDDFHGVYMTVLALRAMHEADLGGCEIVVADNNPISAHGMETALFVKKFDGDPLPVRYVDAREVGGTSAPRNRVFAEAVNPVVVCMDPHVILTKGSVGRLRDHFAANPQSKDIVSGPLLYDTGRTLVGTHFDLLWRAEMEGVWGVARRCGRCREGLVSLTRREGLVAGLTLADPPVEVAECPACRAPIPPVPWPGHERRPEIADAWPLATDSDAPFEIPAQGLGLFAATRATWDAVGGFSPHFREFGGEEGYIHRKVRRHGGRALCLPRVGWYHRFGRPGGPPYKLSWYAKARNYAVGRAETGMTDQDAVKAAFLERDARRAPVLDYLFEDPIGRETPPPEVPAPARPRTPAEIARSVVGVSLDDLHEAVKAIRTDTAAIADTLRDYASRCRSVLCFVKRPEFPVWLAAGRPARLDVHIAAPTEFHDAIGVAAAAAGVEYRRATLAKAADSLTVEPPESVEMLLISTVHTRAHLEAELRRFAPVTTKYIALQATAYAGLVGEGLKEPKSGLLAALQAFCRANPQWSTVHRTDEGYGLIVLSCVEADKQAVESNPFALGWNLTKAIAGLAKDVVPASTALYEARQDTCSLCLYRNGGSCAECGCGLERKAAMRAFKCPLGFWPDPASIVEEPACQGDPATCKEQGRSCGDRSTCGAKKSQPDEVTT